MKRGTKSLLFGVHQFAWHPLTVAYAWRKIYDRWPKWWVWVCIFFHDVGYWGCPEMDGPQGKMHPVRGAELAAKIVRNLAALGWILRSPIRAALDGSYGSVCSTLIEHRAKNARAVCLGHSKHFAKLSGCAVSPLYLADKVSVLFDPKWFYLLRGFLSGEVFEYRNNSLHAFCPVGDWFDTYRLATQQKLVNAMPEKFELKYL